jgi:hypothetical protein
MEQQITLSPVTTISYEKIKALNTFTIDEVEKYNNDIADELGIDGIDIASVVPTDIAGGVVSVDKSSEADKYAVVISGLLQQAKDTNKTIDKLTNDLAIDLQDGSLNSENEKSYEESLYIFNEGASTASANVNLDIIHEIRKRQSGKGDDNNEILNTPNLTATITTISGVKNTAINEFWPTNLGGEATYTMAGNPNGLIIDGDTGVVSGTAVDTATAYTILITATNTSGSSTLTYTYNLSANIQLPNLSNAGEKFYVKGELISPVIFENTGGYEITACSTTPSLPNSLTIKRKTDNSSCVITGKLDNTQIISNLYY